MKRYNVSVLFVCMGNICRSPTVEGVFRHMLETSGLGGRVLADSAGTHGYHAGEAPDRRSQLAASRRGYDLASIRARQVCDLDFERFDLIVAMDRQNRQELERICPPGLQHKLHLLLDFSESYSGRDVPDPYYGGAAGFERVLDMAEDACRGLLASLSAGGGGRGGR